MHARGRQKLFHAFAKGRPKTPDERFGGPSRLHFGTKRTNSELSGFYMKTFL